MEKFHHTLLFGRDAFREMILHPTTDPGVLNGEFVPSNSCLTPEKEALSYLWDGSTSPRSIKLDGKALQITLNLGNALLAFQHKFKSRRLCVDAICIN